MKDHVGALCETNLWKSSATQPLRYAALDVPEGVKIEEELEMSKAEYIPASKAVYATPEDV